MVCEVTGAQGEGFSGDRVGNACNVTGATATGGHKLQYVTIRYTVRFLATFIRIV